jgi:hypothetical protein
MTTLTFRIVEAHSLFVWFPPLLVHNQSTSAWNHVPSVESEICLETQFVERYAPSLWTEFEVHGWQPSLHIPVTLQHKKQKHLSTPNLWIPTN